MDVYVVENKTKTSRYIIKNNCETLFYENDESNKFQRKCGCCEEIIAWKSIPTILIALLRSARQALAL